MATKIVQAKADLNAARTGEVVEKKTFCAICEASCGLVAVVQDGKVASLRPDAEHPSSRGFACSKGVEFHNVVYDPDRVTQPMRRRLDGEFEPATWDEALEDIGARLRAIRDAHGGGSIGAAYGNPIAGNFSGGIAISGLVNALGSHHHYNSSSIDINNYHVVGDMLYGSTMVYPIPDWASTDFTLLIGTNPVVSKGSMVTVGRVRDVLLDVVDRGGRVVVLDPRYTETAQLFEHQPIRPGADPWFLGGMLRVLFDENLTRWDIATTQATGLEFVADLASRFDLDRAARESGIPQDRIVEIARAAASSPAFAIHGRCGASLGRHSTLTKYLIDAIAIVTGNLDRRGGLVFSDPMVDLDAISAKQKIVGRNRWHTRVHGLGEVNGTAPFAVLADEILTPGDGQLRGLITLCSNVVTSGPDTGRSNEALSSLDFMVSIDPYINETTRHADWVLPPTLWLEREQMPLFSQSQSTVPHAQWVRPVVEARGEAKDDGWIITQIANELGLAASEVPGAQLMRRFGLSVPPHVILDVVMRAGKHGDMFGLRRTGISRKKLLDRQGAVKLADHCEVGVLKKKIFTNDKMVHLAHDEITEEVDRLQQDSSDDPRFPLRLFSIRQLRSQNSWLHNVPRLMSDDRQCHAVINPHDAETAGVLDRELVTIESPWGRLDTRVVVTADVMQCSVGLTHGFGHQGSWKRAVAAGGPSYNQLTPSGAEFIDRPSGNAFFNGIPVMITRATGSGDAS
ncbi:anaerobic selenocysteine-containing dehydrogenase [Marmoricola sp. OAE513]|uniref:molybdopterin-dependent oxidoreductase n=1 Tax=Marmoricola sp. OAE513 TaxID=2817894 RepID=UPI001AEA5B34